MIDFKFADIGEGIHEGVILKWEFDVGDTVNEGDTLVIIETDKVNAEIPSPESGTLLKRGPDVGKTVHVGETLAVIGEASEASDKVTAAPEKPAATIESSQENAPKADAKTESVSESGASVVGSVEVSDELMPSSNEHVKKDVQVNNGQILATPVARKMAKDLGIALSDVAGSGPNGRIMKADLQSRKAAAIAPSISQAVPAYRQTLPAFNKERIVREKISGLRKAVVKAMNVSNQVIPATTLIDTFEVDELVKLRTALKPVAAGHDQKLTYLPLIIKAALLFR